MTIGPTHKQHSKTQKETARRRGRNWLKKGDELSEKAEIICGGFFWDPTHYKWRAELCVPEGLEAPVEIHQFLEKLSEHQPKGNMDVTPEKDTTNEQGVLGSPSSNTRSPSSGMNTGRFSSAHLTPTLQTGTENATTTAVTALADTPPSLLVLREIQDHVSQAITRTDEIKIPTIACAEKIEKIDAKLQVCFQRFRSLKPAGNETIETDIIRHAGERKMLELNGLRDAENAHAKQIASVLQTLSDLLITTLGPAAVRRSLQNINTQNRDGDISDGLLIGVIPSLGNMQAGDGSGPLYEKHQGTEIVPESGHNDACHSLCDAGKRSRSKRPRDSSSDEREGQNKRHAALNNTTSGFQSEHARTDRTTQVQVVEFVSSRYPNVYS